MAIDPNIALQVQTPQQQNPLTAYAQIAGIQQAQQQNQLTGLAIQQAQRQQTQADALNNSIKAPGAINADGSLNSPVILSGVANAGAGAAIPALAKQLTEYSTAQLSQQKARVDNATAQLGAVGQVLNGVHDQESWDAARQWAHTNLGPNSLDNAPPVYDPNLVAQAKSQALTAKDALDQHNAEVTQALQARTADETARHNLVDEGNTVRGQNVRLDIAGSRPVSYNDPSTGQPRMTNQAGFNAMLNGGAPAGAGAPTADGRYPTQTGAQPQATGAAFPSIGAGLAPGEAAAAETAAKGSANQYVADQAATNGYAGRIFQLQKALTALQSTNTGAGTNQRNAILSYLQTAGVPGIDPNKIASYDEANKYLTQYALNQSSNFGNATDSKLATTLSGNASTSISNLAAQDVVKANIGLERMKQAQINAFDASGLPASQYQKFSTRWNSQVDPRVFIVDQLAPDKKAALRDSMSAAQRQTFTSQYNAALQNGWIPGQGQ